MKSFTLTIQIAALVLAVAGSPIVNSSATHINPRDTVSGMQYCGVFAAANGPMAGSLIAQLGEGDLKDRVYTTAPGGCNRVQCWDTSGVFVCNDNTYELSLTGAVISHVANIVNTECCMLNEKMQSINRQQMAGQQFTQWGWNVVIGYADCNHDGTQKPSTIGGYGVNGDTCFPDSSMMTNG